LLSRLAWGLLFPLLRGSSNLFYRLKLQFVGLVAGLKTHDNAEWLFLFIWPMINLRREREFGEVFQFFFSAPADFYGSSGLVCIHEHYVEIEIASTAQPQAFCFYVGFPLGVLSIERHILFAEKVNGLLLHLDMACRLSIHSVLEGRLRPVGRIGVAIKGNGSWIAFPWLGFHFVLLM